MESAFVTLYNKLGRNRSEILTPFITQVEKLRDKNFISHPGGHAVEQRNSGSVGAESCAGYFESKKSALILLFI